MSKSEFTQLLTTNVDFLKPVAITLTRDPHSAADLYQETLYKALANQEKYSVGTNIKAWLYTIMRNIFINNYRRKLKQKMIFDLPPVDARAENLQATVGNNAESEMGLKYIQQAVHNLPELFRRPLVMYFDGYKYHDIADMLNEPLGTIKSRIHFARKLLKSQLQRF